MKKPSLLIILTLIISLFLATTHVLAESPVETMNAKTPGPQNTPGPHTTPGAKATEKAILHGKRQNFRGTIAAVSPVYLTLTLQDGSTQTFNLTAETRIHIPGRKPADASLQTGMKAMVQAIADENNNFTAQTVLAIPGQPVRTHRVGWVSANTPGTSIVIQGSDGNLYTFTLTADTKILPAERVNQLAVGARVTIIAPRLPSASGWTAAGIVLHPAGTGSGSQPAATPTT